MRLCKKRNKSATLRLLDVLVTQHAKWTARRIRRALFGQSLLDFSGSSWSSVKIHKSAPEPTQVNRRKSTVSRMTREFSQVAVETNNVPGMSQYSESQELFEDVDMEVGTEDFHEADQTSAAISQRCEFFDLSPRMKY